MRARLAKMLGRWIEILVLLLVVVSPWLFGGVEPIHEFWLFGLLAVAMVFWGLRVLLEGAVLWRPCGVVFCLLGMLYLGFMQLLPLPGNILGVLSPATERTFEFLRPLEPEALDPEKGDFAAQKVEQNSLTFYRSGTAQTICRMLAALCLFGLVRNNISSRGGLIRLSIVAVINGTALSLLAILQLFSSPATDIYWTYHAPVVVFGPFICRNHFPFYINCCIGLGLGLLLYTQSSSRSSDSSRNGSGNHHSKHRRHRTHHAHSENGSTTHAYDTSLIRPETLWLGGGLALMISAVVLSLSRGGVVVLFATSFLGLALWGRSLFKLSRSTTGILVAGAGTFALLSWLGFNLFKERLETLWKGGGLEARTPLWSGCLPLMGQFPIFGTGYGTFQLVEPIHRAYVSEDFNQLTFAHAHNEYIEAMVEGGLLRLCLSVAAIGFVFAAGYRILRRQPGASSGLAAGALFAFTTVVLHSAGDFGMHVPAITILAAVIAAYIVGLAEDVDPKDGRGSRSRSTSVRMIRWGGLAPLLAAGLCIGVGLLLLGQSYRWQLVQRFLNAGMQRGSSNDLVQQQRRIEFLKTAATLAPDFAITEMELGQAYYEAFAGQQNKVAELQTYAEICEAFLSAQYRDGSPFAVIRLFANLEVADTGWRAYAASREAEFEKTYLAPALRYFIVARDLCPLLGKPHARLAANRYLLAQGDKSEAYMERVRYLRQYDPEVWYIIGILNLAAFHPEAAWENWKRSLELSDAFLMEIVHRSLTVLSVDQLLEKVLPEKPAQILRAGTELYPKASDNAERAPFISRTLELLDKPGRVLTASDRHLKAKALYLAGKPTDSLTAYRVAIQHNPSQIDLRLEYANLLHELGFVREATWELTGILDSEPGNARAQEMLAAFDRKDNPKER